MDKENLELEKIRQSTDSTLARLQSHIKNDNNIEYIQIGSSLVQYSLVRILHTYELTINISLIFGDFDTFLKVKAKTESGENAIGHLIAELERFCADEKLLQSIRNFNGIRKSVTHKLYEKYQDISKVNEELRGQIKNDPVASVIKDLIKLHQQLQGELYNKIREFDPDQRRQIGKFVKKGESLEMAFKAANIVVPV